MQASASLTSPKSGGCISTKFWAARALFACTGDRFRDFVSQRGSQFSDQADAVRVGEFRRYARAEVTIDMLTHLSHLPGEQSLSSGRRLGHSLRIDLLAQQRSGFKNHALSWLFGLQLTSSRVEQDEHSMHPFT